MAYETRVNSGGIFKNDKKGNDKAPDYRGTINVEGKELEIALWVKESQKGEKFFSAKIQEKQEKGSYSKKTEDTDSSLPF